LTLVFPVIMSKNADIEWKQKLAAQIRSAREEAGLTQAELAEQTHVTRQTIIKYESEGVPLIDIFARIAAELEKPFRIKDLVITVERTSPRLRTVPKQLRLEFEKSQTFSNAVVSITPKEGQILINAKIPA
jgi:transcriptional regulator with XRE-family HTH domain